jgi:hypothetical protein
LSPFTGGSTLDVPNPFGCKIKALVTFPYAKINKLIKKNKEKRRRRKE